MTSVGRAQAEDVAQRAFGLSRINLRRMGHAGELPGVTKSGW
nr:hypothetical protein [Streptomyces zhaozhouensis]